MNWLKHAILLLQVVSLLLPDAYAHAHGDIDGQIDELTAAIAQSPTDARLRLRRGELHVRHGDLASAEDDLQAALALNPSLDAAHLAWSRLALAAGDTAESLARADRYLSADPRSVDGHLARAAALAAGGIDHLAAADAYAAATAHAPEPRPEWYVARARHLHAAGQAAQAVAALDSGIARLGKTVVALHDAAVEVLVADGQYVEAIARIDSVLASAPVAPYDWLVRRGDVSRAGGNQIAARSDYERAIQLIDALPAHRRQLKAIATARAAAITAIEASTRDDTTSSTHPVTQPANVSVQDHSHE